MKRQDHLLWRIDIAEGIGKPTFDTFTVAADSAFDALTIAERELSHRKQGNMVITEVKHVGEAVSWEGVRS